MTIALFIIGCWFVFMGLITNAGDLTSKLIFKAIPFFFGVYVAYYAALMEGWLY